MILIEYDNHLKNPTKDDVSNFPLIINHILSVVTYSYRIMLGFKNDNAQKNLIGVSSIFLVLN